MKDQFDIWHYDWPDKGGLHSVVLISHPDRCVRAKHLNVLFCTSQRQSRQPHPHEVMLDKADGFDWETFCDCSILWVVESGALFNKRGHVTLERRRAIREKVRDLLRLGATD